MRQAKLGVGDTLQAMRVSFEENFALIARLTIIVAALIAVSSLLNVAGAAGLAVLLGFTILLGTAYGGMITALICLPGKPEGAGHLWEAVKPALARLIWVALIVWVAVLAGVAVFVLPGLIILTVWSVSSQVVLVERTTVFRALGRSFELVRENEWRVFSFILILGVLTLLMLGITLAITFPLGSSTVANLVRSFLSNLLSTPVVAIGTAALYNQLSRIDRERRQATDEPSI